MPLTFYLPAIKRRRAVVLHCVKDRLPTEDLSQVAFLKIYTSLKCGKYNEQGKFLPWPLRIARNLCMDYLRKSPEHQSLYQMPADNFLRTPPQRNVDCKLTAKQQEQELNAFINRLPEDQKKVVYYRYFEEMSFKEIATLMNTSVNTSLGRMRYGLAHLRKQIKSTSSTLR